MDDPYSKTIHLSPAIFLIGTFDAGHFWSFIAIAILLVLSALMSGSEVSYFSLSSKQIDELTNESLKKKIQSILSKPKKLLATILIANNAVNLAIVIISGFLTDYFFESSQLPFWVEFIIQVVAVTFIILLFGEVLPKVYATYDPMSIAKLMINPMLFLNKALSWLSTPLMLSSSFIDKRLRKKEKSVSAGHLSAVIDLTQDESVTEEEKRIWKGIVEFGTISVKETMKPRIDVMAVDISITFNELLDEILKAGYSRIPVYEDTFDHVKGVLYIKDLLPYLEEKNDFEWQKLMRPPFYVPENKKIDDLLKEFQAKKMHMAIVVDEFGGSSGIVTLEDIIEEIVGEINDEFDDDEIVYSKLDEQNYVFEGKTTLINLCRIMDIEYESLEPYVGESDTLAGLILELNGQIPIRNQILDCNHLRFTIESVDRRRIKRIKVTRITQNENAEV